jgi:hypothetical protein
MKSLPIQVHSHEFSVSTQGETDIIDVTSQGERGVAASGIQNGQALVRGTWQRRSSRPPMTPVQSRQ